ncbi:SIS domain-containing protein [Streptococcus pluranimalium]|uniref:SIS domain-containing protein n=1 Tax=Streptococcus pluranimalium TaxID=82348 RepID=UPI002414F8E0|nr:SIS domain-containing protein [Streptococcus pluranimalium]MDY3041283.1 SIS domain-containing protein [Streptococcus pluranimalium]WFM80050.1 SIS domain-containing protein [Streptococcus pluranimalium]
MFQLSTEELTKLGAEITTREIKQQPKLWLEALSTYQLQKDKIDCFLSDIIASANGKAVKVIFTGAGTSEYVGNSIASYLQTNGDREHFLFSSVATTDIVAAPHYYFYPEDTVLLVSFARSGNSPESLAAVELANQLIDNIYHLTITCAPEGELAKAAHSQDNNFLLLQPQGSNDAGFAMTGSFSCMMLSALLVFDRSIDENQKKNYVDTAASLAESVINREQELQELVDLDFDRLVYIGSGSLSGLTREAQLKILELTAGKIVTVFDSSMGFRHGPKSFVNDKTIVIGFVNNHTYVRQYDLDILEEVEADKIAVKTLALAQDGATAFSGQTFGFDSDVLLPDAYLALPYIFVAQTIALLSSIKVNNLPDTPSASGTVNRVVKGVTIHDYKA